MSASDHISLEVQLGSGIFDAQGNEYIDFPRSVAIPKHILEAILGDKDIACQIERYRESYKGEVLNEILMHGIDSVRSCGLGYETLVNVDCKKHHKTKPGFVYLLKTAGQDSFKIGITCANNVGNRIAQIQTNSPHNIECLGYIEVDDARSVEKALHESFSCKNIKREWFALTVEEAVAAYSQYGEFKRDGW